MSGTDLEPTIRRRVNEDALGLAAEWRRLGRAATLVAVITSPVAFALLRGTLDAPLGWALAGTFLSVIAFRGLIDVLAHRLIPMPSLYGADRALAEEDVVARRRLWYWRKKFRRVVVVGSLFVAIVLVLMAIDNVAGNQTSFGGKASDIWHSIAEFLPSIFGFAPTLVFLFLINFLILFGPMVALGIQQIKGYEPGDADWGVKLSDVRGQKEAKEEITRVVSLWQSGDDFEEAGGKRERGVMFLGAPGTGKTMLSKAIATGFNCPFVTIPGSGFAQTFIGMDAIIVRFLARKAKKLAAKWGGQCIVFIDEIDAVGMRRQSLGAGTAIQPTLHDWCFYGPRGALTPDGDLVLETAAWRDRLFAERAPASPGSPYPQFVHRVDDFLRTFIVPGGMGGGGMALNQLLVVMDGIQDPPATKKFFTNRINTFLDATYLVPRKFAGRSLRMHPPAPRKEEIYFIGACNVPLHMLDPALTRPGRMGRHIYFRTPTWEDRRDIFDLYLDKVDHEPELDTDKARDELARITNGYSPAMIDQACSLALTYAHSDGRGAFDRKDLVEAMTTVETGVAIGQPYVPHEERATAIHEAGHAVCSHLYSENTVSTRLSIRKRGATGGHHQAMQVEDRFAEWRSEEVAGLIWTLGAMAAEHVFYGQNTTGVGGDVQSVTMQAARMVGFHAMAPAPVDLRDRIEDAEERGEAEERVMKRFEEIGAQIMHRSPAPGGMMGGDMLGPILGDKDKRRLVAGLLGQAFVVAWNTIRANREGVDQVASELVARQELHGDEVVELLDRVGLHKPEIDVLDEASWPTI